VTVFAVHEQFHFPSWAVIDHREPPIHFLLGRPRDTEIEKSRPFLTAADDCGAARKQGLNGGWGCNLWSGQVCGGPKRSTCLEACHHLFVLNTTQQLAIAVRPQSLPYHTSIDIGHHVFFHIDLDGHTATAHRRWLQDSSPSKGADHFHRQGRFLLDLHRRATCDEAAGNHQGTPGGTYHLR
jgi:hypothetical protein